MVSNAGFDTYVDTSPSGLKLKRRVGLRKLHNACTSARKQKARFDERANYLILLGWPMGLEPTTTGITILDSTN
jgi:hypothetical protein